MPPKPVILTTRSFDKQGDAVVFFREMLKRYLPGQRVSDSDAADLTALLTRHPEHAAKVGTGIDHFEVMATEHGSNCFRIVRGDGTGTDFSFMTCIAQRAPSQAQQVSRALRHAIRFDLYAARDNFFAEHIGPDGMVPCAVSHERIGKDDGHMDHRPPMTFEVIVETFLAGQRLSADDVPITQGQDDQVVPEVTDKALIEAFQAYHSSVAKLDFVKVKVNLAQASRNRVRPTRINLKK